VIAAASAWLLRRFNSESESAIRLCSRVQVPPQGVPFYVFMSGFRSIAARTARFETLWRKNLRIRALG